MLSEILEILGRRDEAADSGMEERERMRMIQDLLERNTNDVHLHTTDDSTSCGSSNYS